MNRRPVASLCLGVLLACGAAEVGSQPQRQIPGEAGVERAIRDMLAADHARRDESKPCIPVPLTYPAPDAQSRLRNFGRHADFLKAGSTNPARVQQLAALDSLAAAGLMQREDVLADAKGAVAQPAWRYTITEKGWAHMGSGDCMVYGERVLLGLAGSETRKVGATDVRLVKARVGIAGPDALAPWARDRAFQEAYPQVREQLVPREQTFAVVWRDGKWQRYQGEQNQAESQLMPKRSTEDLARIARIEAMPEASRDELVKLVSRFPERSCLILPGTEKLPADKVFHDAGDLYQFGIYQDKMREQWDSVARKTVPVLEKMLAGGAIIRISDRMVAGEGLDRGKTFMASVYVLAPQLQALMRNNCVSLGRLRHEVLVLEYRKNEDFGWPAPVVKYKAVVKPIDPPRELTDPVLLSVWPDLRGALERGQACAGEYRFNKEWRQLESGGASCWYAFDSYYENY